MAYAYWKSGKTDDVAVFDLFFRNNPFHGEFTIFAGLEECLKFLKNFHYSTGDIDYLKTVLPEGIEEEFFEYLGKLTAKDITFYAMDEGSVAFPKIPIIKVEGPLIVAQLLETTLLTLVNYARYSSVLSPTKTILIRFRLWSQLDGHERRPLPHRVRTAHQIAGIRSSTSSRPRWWP